MARQTTTVVLNWFPTFYVPVFFLLHFDVEVYRLFYGKRSVNRDFRPITHRIQGCFYHSMNHR